MTKDFRAGLEYAIALVDTYAAGSSGSRRPYADVRAETAAEIAKCLRAVVEHHTKPSKRARMGRAKT